MKQKTQSIREQDLGAVWHPYSRWSVLSARDFPVITGAEGIYLFDADGNRYIDGISSWWCCNLGHRHPRLVEAIRRQSGVLIHSILGNMTHPPAVALAGRLATLLGGARHVLFASDGASAVEAGLKIALQYWQNLGQPARTRFVSLQNAYHGDTLGAIGVGYLAPFHQAFRPVLAPALRAVAPCCGQLCPEGCGPDRACELQCLASMQTLLEEHAAEIAAVIVEPLCQGAGGMKIYKPDYLSGLAALCRRHEVLLITDEIATGFGRTGRMFAFEHAGIDPDIVCVGKGLSGGCLPISATAVKDSVFETFGDEEDDHTFYHGHTFCGNPLACAVALETLAVYEQDSVVERAARTGRVLAESMRGVADVAGIRDVRTLGMIAAVEVAPQSADALQAVRRALQDEGILVRPLGNVVYLMLPLITPEGIVSHVAERLRHALAGAPIRA